MSSTQALPCRRASFSRLSSVLTPVPLPIHQQRESLFKAELAGLRIFLLLDECIGHAAHAHGVQFLYRLLVEHNALLLSLRVCRRLALRREIKVIGAANIVVLNLRLRGRWAGQRESF